MFVRSDDVIEVLGASNMTVVDARSASRGDGPLGIHIAGVTLSVLSDGDCYDLKTGQITFSPAKAPIARGAEAGQATTSSPTWPGTTRSTAPSPRAWPTIRPRRRSA